MATAISKIGQAIIKDLSCCRNAGSSSERLAGSIARAICQQTSRRQSNPLSRGCNWPWLSFSCEGSRGRKPVRFEFVSGSKRKPGNAAGLSFLVGYAAHTPGLEIKLIERLKYSSRRSPTRRRASLSDGSPGLWISWSPGHTAFVRWFRVSGCKTMRTPSHVALKKSRIISHSGRCQTNHNDGH